MCPGARATFRRRAAQDAIQSIPQTATCACPGRFRQLHTMSNTATLCINTPPSQRTRTGCLERFHADAVDGDAPLIRLRLHIGHRRSRQVGVALIHRAVIQKGAKYNAARIFGQRRQRTAWTKSSTGAAYGAKMSHKSRRYLCFESGCRHPKIGHPKVPLQPGRRNPGGAMKSLTVGCTF